MVHAENADLIDVLQRECVEKEGKSSHTIMQYLDSNGRGRSYRKSN